jgi:hypothetical protein
MMAQFVAHAHLTLFSYFHVNFCCGVPLGGVDDPFSPTNQLPAQQNHLICGGSIAWLWSHLQSGFDRGWKRV